MISLINFRSSREWEYVKNLVFNLKYEFFIKIVYSVFKVSILLYSYLKKIYIVSLKPNFHSQATSVLVISLHNYPSLLLGSFSSFFNLRKKNMLPTLRLKRINIIIHVVITQHHQWDFLAMSNCFQKNKANPKKSRKLQQNPSHKNISLGNLAKQKKKKKNTCCNFIHLFPRRSQPEGS